jgi:N-acetylglutamate synthase-like GNAT family acetyltransferase
MMRIRPLHDRDRMWAKALVAKHFGSSRVVSRGVLHETSLCPGLVAEADHHPIGLLHYHVEQNQCEIITLIAIRQRIGVGTALLQALRRQAAAAQWERIWLITTNDNLVGQMFYESVGLRQVSIYPGAIAESRKLKPEIPAYGENGIAIADEIEYEWSLHG